MALFAVAWYMSGRLLYNAMQQHPFPADIASGGSGAKGGGGIPAGEGRGDSEFEAVIRDVAYMKEQCNDTASAHSKGKKKSDREMCHSWAAWAHKKARLIAMVHPMQPHFQFIAAANG